MLSRRSLTAWALSAALLGAAGGCGGGNDNQSASSSGGGSPPQESGKDLFTHTCAGCHTLKDAGTNGSVGPNLDEIAPSKDLVLATLRAGPGAMPTNLLVGAEADRVATYVSSVAGK
jgi:cytochrome c6